MSLPILTATLHQTQPTLLELLLKEQRGLSAVDLFSDWHESNSIAAATYQALMPATALKSGQQYAFEVDLDACSGCKACVVACHTLNGLEETETWRKVGSLSSQSIHSLPIVQHVTTACHHCVDPGCLSGCPVQAYEKDPVTGIVRHLDDQCFGCKYCTMTCPYEVPQYSSTLGIVRKCDMCSQRLNVGEAPACVQACPNQAIRIAIVDVATIVSKTTRQNSTSTLVSTAPLSRITLPTTRYVTVLPIEATVELCSGESIVDKAHEGHLPLVVMIVLTQASVGMWLVFAASRSMGGAGPHFFVAAIATAIGIIGVHVALLHLGRPWLAYRAFLGWRTSWLSREAIGFGLFMGAAIVATGAKLFIDDGSDAGSIRYAMFAEILVALIGLLAVVCTGMIYVATRRELWGGVRTGIDFGLSTIGLGLVGASASLDGLPSMLPLIGLLCCMAAATAKVIDYRRAKAVSIRWDDFSARSGKIIRTELATQWSILWILYSLALALSIGLSIAIPYGFDATLGFVETDFKFQISNFSIYPSDLNLQFSNLPLNPTELHFQFPNRLLFPSNLKFEISNFSLYPSDLKFEISNLSIAIFAICLFAQAFLRWLYFASIVYRRMPGARV